MRIGVVGPTHPFKGGVAQHTTVLANKLAAAGHDVEIVSWDSQYPRLLYPGAQEVSGDPEVPAEVVVTRRLHWARPWTWVTEGRRLRGIDLLVIAHVTPMQAPPHLVLARASASVGRHLTVLCHNVLPHEPAPMQEPLVRALLGAADLVLTHSGEQAVLARQLTAKPVAVVPLPPFAPRSFGGVGEDRGGEHKRLLFFGLVRPYKGLDVLLRALAAGPADIALRVAGEFWGGIDPYMDLCHELGIDDRVELIAGYVPAPEVSAIFEGVDALVLPYRTATGSQGPMIAFERGLPVISTDAGHLATSVRNGVDGIVVSAGDVAALTAAIVELYRPGRLAELRGRVEPPDETFMWDRYLETLTGGP